MGALYNLDLTDLIKKHDLVNFVETGTGEAVSLTDALKYNLKKYFSVEIHEEIFKNLNEKKFPNNVYLFNRSSIEGLKEIFNNVPLEENCLIWLDAHFANGSDFGKGFYLDCCNDNELNFPLEKELELIKQIRKGKDVIICDDVRIYQDGPFTGGCWSNREHMKIGDISFAYKLFEDTHNLTINHLDQGYLFIEPKI